MLVSADGGGGYSGGGYGNSGYSAGGGCELTFYCMLYVTCVFPQHRCVCVWCSSSCISEPVNLTCAAWPVPHLCCPVQTVQVRVAATRMAAAAAPAHGTKISQAHARAGIANKCQDLGFFARLGYALSVALQKRQVKQRNKSSYTFPAPVRGAGSLAFRTGLDDSIQASV